MSVAIGIHAGDYVVLAADTRLTYYPPGGVVYRDGKSKIRTTTMGLVTGTGWSQLLDAVTARFAAETIVSTDDILRIIRDERSRHAALPAATRDPMVRDALQTTGWLFSYLKPETDWARLRLIFCHPSVDNRLGSVEEGRAVVMMPTSATPEEAGEWNRLVEEHVRVWKAPSTEQDLQASIGYHVRLVAQVVDEVAAGHDGVSPTFQVGVQTLFGQRGISDVAERGRPFALHLNMPATVGTETE